MDLAPADGRASVLEAGSCVTELRSLSAAVVSQWRRAGPALADVRRQELRRLTDQEALAAAVTLLDLERHLPPRTDGSGLVEQQRIFARARG